MQPVFRAWCAGQPGHLPGDHQERVHEDHHQHLPFQPRPRRCFFLYSFLLYIFLHISILTFLIFLPLQPCSHRPGHLGLGHARRALSHVAAISVDLWRGDFKIDIKTIHSWILLHIILSVNLWRGDFKGQLIFGRTFVLCYTTISRIKNSPLCL